MARRGTPLPLAVKEDIKERRKRGDSLRTIAGALRLAVNTVRKYTRKIDTEYLQYERLIA